MNRLERKEFVKSFDGGCYSMVNEKLHFNNNFVGSQTLALIIDVMQDPPMLMVHGEHDGVDNVYETKTKALEKITGIKLIMVDVPIKMYKWVNVITEISASKWCMWLLMEMYFKTLN